VQTQGDGATRRHQEVHRERERQAGEEDRNARNTNVEGWLNSRFII